MVSFNLAFSHIVTFCCYNSTPTTHLRTCRVSDSCYVTTIVSWSIKLLQQRRLIRPSLEQIGRISDAGPWRGCGRARGCRGGAQGQQCGLGIDPPSLVAVCWQHDTRAEPTRPRTSFSSILIEVPIYFCANLVLYSCFLSPILLDLL